MNGRSIFMAIVASLFLTACNAHMGGNTALRAAYETPQEADRIAMVMTGVKLMRLPAQPLPQQSAGRLLLVRDQQAVNPYLEKGPRKWRAYCARQPADCAVNANGGFSVSFTPALWQALQQVNQSINAKIRYTPDDENGQGADKWVRPELAGRVYALGDCEDYVLAKRHHLLAMGLPAGALRFTLVARGKSRHADHAVLVVATDYGDFVLDNVKDVVRPVEATSYRYISMHLPSAADPHRFRHTLARPQLL